MSPSPNFVALVRARRGQHEGLGPGLTCSAKGMVATTTEDPPAIDAVRCVPKGWCVQSKVKPKLVWEDSGAGGRKVCTRLRGVHHGC